MRTRTSTTYCICNGDLVRQWARWTHYLNNGTHELWDYGTWVESHAADQPLTKLILKILTTTLPSNVTVLKLHVTLPNCMPLFLIFFFYIISIFSMKLQNKTHGLFSCILICIQLVNCFQESVCFEQKRGDSRSTHSFEVSYLSVRKCTHVLKFFLKDSRLLAHIVDDIL